MRRRMHTDAEKRPSTPSAGPGRHTDTSSGPDTPQGAEAASVGKRRKRITPKIAKQAALGIEAAGTLLAKAVDAMEAARSDAEVKQQWREIGLILNDHADALLQFLAFCGSHIDRAEIDAAEGDET